MNAPRIVRANWPYKAKRSGPKINPALLFVNRESRQEALKRYEKVCGDDGIYADFTQDTIFVDSGSLNFRLDRANYESRIQILAIDYSYFQHKAKLLLWKIRRCSHLRRLILVMPAQMEFDLSPKKLGDPIASVKFKELNAKNYCSYGQVRGNVCAYFERIWGLLDADLPYLEVYLVRCH
jgi:hypothetical protein